MGGPRRPVLGGHVRTSSANGTITIPIDISYLSLSEWAGNAIAVGSTLARLRRGDYL